MNLDQELDFTDDEDFNELLNMYLHPRRQRVFRERTNHFEKWNENEFLQRFRLSQHTSALIIEELTPYIENETLR